MSQLPDARRMVAEAEHAASVGDLATADELLNDAARIQEAELGPFHPDLASTLNNRAIVAENAGRLGEAETFYRRASAIVSQSLPVDDPAVAASRQNLEDFCRAHDLPIDPPAVPTASVFETNAGPDVFSREAGTVAEARPAPRTMSRPLLWVAIVTAVLVTGAVLAREAWWRGESGESRNEPPASQAVPAPEQAVREPALPAGVDPPKAVTDVPPAEPVAPVPSSAGVMSLTTAQLCQTFSATGSRWRCDPAGEAVEPGPVVFYTRVRSPRDVAVVHRWYRGDTLRQSVTLTVRANTAEGFRTYSRQTVDPGGAWRVEVRSVDGRVLHTQRFAVR